MHVYTHCWFCDCLRIVVSNTCCVVFFYILFVFVLCLLYQMLPVYRFSGLSILDYPIFSVSLMFIAKLLTKVNCPQDHVTTSELGYPVHAILAY